MPWNPDGTRKRSNLYKKSSGFKMKRSTLKFLGNFKFTRQSKENPLARWAKKHSSHISASSGFNKS